MQTNRQLLMLLNTTKKLTNSSFSCYWTFLGKTSSWYVNSQTGKRNNLLSGRLAHWTIRRSRYSHNKHCSKCDLLNL